MSNIGKPVQRMNIQSQSHEYYCSDRSVSIKLYRAVKPCVVRCYVSKANIVLDQGMDHSVRTVMVWPVTNDDYYNDSIDTI